MDISSGVDFPSSRFTFVADIPSQDGFTSKGHTPPCSRRPPTTILSLNYDILLNVFSAFEEISSSGTSQGFKKHLLWAALTCTAFKDPSTDILWRSMDSIFPLLRLLPTVELVNGIYMICGAIRDEDMARFELYAMKIRRFTRSSPVTPSSETSRFGHQNPSPQPSQYPLAPSIYALLEPFLHIQYLTFLSVQALSAPEAPFFIPYCSTFRDSGNSTSSVCSVSPLRWIGPPNSSSSITSASTLELVEIGDARTNNRSLDDDFLRMRPFIHALKTRAPELQHLVITIQTSPRLWELIVDFKNLRSLEFSGIMDVIIFRRLAISLPELQRLVVNFLDTAPLRTSFPDIDADANLTFPFEKLRTLKISGKGSTVASYFVCMRGGNVENLSINLEADSHSSSRFNSTSEQWDVCMSVMKEQWAASLQYTRLETSQIILTSPSFFIDLSTFSLRYVEIEAKISATDCDMLARSLPNVTSLYIHLIVSTSTISHGRSSEGHPGADALGPDVFASFATHCSNLRSMDLAFEKAFTSFSLSRWSCPVNPHSLRTLSISSEDRLDVDILLHTIKAARLLHQVFPFLEVLRTRDNHASAPFWGHVYQLYKEFGQLLDPRDDDLATGGKVEGPKKPRKKGKRR